MEYILLIGWLGLSGLIAHFFNIKKTIVVNKVEVERTKWIFAFLVFLPIIILAGNRSIWIADTLNYANSYDRAPSEFALLREYVSDIGKDKGYYAFAAIIKILFKLDYRAYFFLLAFIQGISVLSIFQRYSENYVLSVFFFVASADFTWMMNGIRQFTAVTIILAATALLVKKHFFPLVLIIIFASFFHQSALIMIPLVFIVSGKAWNKRTILFMIFVLLSIIFLDRFTSFLDNTLQETTYAKAADYINNEESKGANPLRLIFFSLPALFSFFGRKKIVQADDDVINIFVNMSILTSGISIVSIFTSGMLVGRLPVYTCLYSYILLPWLVNHIILEKYKKYAIVVLIIIFLIFYIYQMYFTWGFFENLRIV